MDTPELEFKGFPKVPRLMRDVCITEKIDGTNGLVYVELVEPYPQGCSAAEEADWQKGQPGPDATVVDFADGTRMAVYAGSRKRWITPTKDNYGFARWVEANAETLARDLGPGRYFGEWWGSGIQRRYGLQGDDKRFSLFNVRKFRAYSNVAEEGTVLFETPGVSVVPVLYEGPIINSLGAFTPNIALGWLAANGSQAKPGFMDPEGIMVYHTRAGQMFKYTLGGDRAKGEDHG